MEVAFTECVPVTDASSVGAVRRSAQMAGQRLDFDEKRAGDLALLATELSRNVLVHGGGGQVIVEALKCRGKHVARLLAMDKGPGITSIPKAMSDGYSTAGTMGGGLGAMRRMASGFEIFSSPGGTVVHLEVGELQRTCELEVGGMAVPYPGERVCGDGWMVHQTAEKTVVFLVDGIGHGIGAADAAREALEAFQKCADNSPGEILHQVHDALRKTRGAVAAVAEIYPEQNVLLFAGVGNISASVIDLANSRGLISHNGTLGAMAPRIQQFSIAWSNSSMLVMHSDGLQTRWDLGAYAGLAVKHPAVIGGALMRDFRRDRDDASVVVVKGK